MAAEAVAYQADPDQVQKSSAHAALTAGEVILLPDGRAGVVASADNSAGSVASGSAVNYAVQGVYKVTKTASQVILNGGEVWWDHSAGKAVYAPANDKDFYLGTAFGDAASADTTMYVQLNEKPNYIISLQESAFQHVPVLTAGTPNLAMVGGTARAAFSATAEAQKLDLLSARSFPIGSDWILDAEVEIATNADADVADLNIGVANATHASDADSIAESVFVHLDMGADLNIDCESDDGSTEVVATDSTVDFAVGTAFRLTIDGRNHTDIQIYINGALVLSGSTFTLAAGTGPLKALFHLEKSANDSPGVVNLNKLNVRIMDVTG